ncbi:methyltransferase domain-containing protein [Caulobacter segnis]|uniref:Methyltransferase type 12 n=1 Tax=Caulobacter segnis (strain ATCC 21756 / DSM 7131 / JCM 7823 / NBRC 15250 / LMG 17158 / TK0059) TaxID=509190 RepID=D5VL54_CAUST|nr:methyltransferase domain-containing protein [Caulobacter segnis]ADG11227.1 Methyltransferase type 12 [Caulobacter segnis ATCC 21756]
MNTLQETFDRALASAAEGRFDAAVSDFQAVLALRPDEGPVLFSLGVTLMNARRFPEAAAALSRAVATQDVEPLWRNCLAQAQYMTGDFAGAAASFEAVGEPLGDGAVLTWARAAAYAAVETSTADTALALYERIAGPLAEDPTTVVREGFSILVAFKRLAAARVLGDWLAANTADDPVQAHERRVLTEQDIDRAPSDYVEALFDNFADRFDEQLVDNLGYDAPALLADKVAALDDRFARILDLGCGTGLAGPHLRRFQGRITGVDLSSGMLARAAERGDYDQLIQAEAIDFLRGASDGFDLIFSTDVLIYFGDLTPLFAAAAGALPSGGVLAVSTERGEDGWMLLPSARYAHGEAYVRQASAPWFDLVDQVEISLRRDATDITPGGLYVMRRKG